MFFEVSIAGVVRIRRHTMPQASHLLWIFWYCNIILLCAASKNPTITNGGTSWDRQRLLSPDSWLATRACKVLLDFPTPKESILCSIDHEHRCELKAYDCANSRCIGGWASSIFPTMSLNSSQNQLLPCPKVHVFECNKIVLHPHSSPTTPFEEHLGLKFNDALIEGQSYASVSIILWCGNIVNCQLLSKQSWSVVLHLGARHQQEQMLMHFFRCLSFCRPFKPDDALVRSKSKPMMCYTVYLATGWILGCISAPCQSCSERAPHGLINVVSTACCILCSAKKSLLLIPHVCVIKFWCDYFFISVVTVRPIHHYDSRTTGELPRNQNRPFARYHWSIVLGCSNNLERTRMLFFRSIFRSWIAPKWADRCWFGAWMWNRVPFSNWFDRVRIFLSAYLREDPRDDLRRLSQELTWHRKSGWCNPCRCSFQSRHCRRTHFDWQFRIHVVPHGSLRG